MQVFTQLSQQELQTFDSALAASLWRQCCSVLHVLLRSVWHCYHQANVETWRTLLWRNCDRVCAPACQWRRCAAGYEGIARRQSDTRGNWYTRLPVAILTVRKPSAYLQSKGKRQRVGDSGSTLCASAPHNVGMVLCMHRSLDPCSTLCMCLIDTNHLSGVIRMHTTDIRAFHLFLARFRTKAMSWQRLRTCGTTRQGWRRSPGRSRTSCSMDDFAPFQLSAAAGDLVPNS
jgi:hypothetical protein